MTLRNLFISLIALTLIAISHSHAEIHLDDFAGVWLFDEGKGNIVKDLTDNGNDGEYEQDLQDLQDLQDKRNSWRNVNL